MKSRESLIRLKRFQVDEKRRQVSQVEMMIAEFMRMIGDLDDQIVAEQNRVGIHDITHFAYPTFAKAARLRRDNLRTSQAGLIEQRRTAEQMLSEATAELEKAEMLESRDSRGRDAEHEVRSAIMN